VFNFLHAFSLLYYFSAFETGLSLIKTCQCTTMTCV